MPPFIPLKTIHLNCRNLSLLPNLDQPASAGSPFARRFSGGGTPPSNYPKAGLQPASKSAQNQPHQPLKKPQTSNTTPHTNTQPHL